MKNDELIRRRIAIAQRRLAAARLLFEKNFLNEVLSTAYFAVFSATQALLASKELQSNKHSVISMFNLHFVKTGLIDKQFNTILGRAKEARELSDYGDFYETTEQECRGQLQAAEQFVEMAINFMRARGIEFTANQ